MAKENRNPYEYCKEHRTISVKTTAGCPFCLKSENAHLLDVLAAYEQEHEDYLAGTMEKRLRDALQSLHDQQNGPPLIRRQKEWQAAMDESEALL